jgi:glycosyltransferase involved in cell wall biosynthesis
VRLGRRLFGCWGKKVIAISAAVEKHLINDFKVEPKRAALIHTGIDIEKFKAENRKSKLDIKKEYGLKEGPVVGIIARLSSVKGHKFLVSAMQKVIEKNKAAQLLIVGEGEEEASLRELARKLGIADSVIFERTALDTRELLSIMDVFVLPSIAEGLGLSILEAQAAGVAVVASDVGGISSIIKGGTTGLLVAPADPDRLAAAILRLLEDKELAAALAGAGRKFVCENFSIEDMVKKVEAVYQEVLR